MKIKDIQKFPIPICLIELCSFIGMVNQLGWISSEISTAAASLIDLMKT